MAQENTARVITIVATEQPQDIRLRVAAYARVSSSSDEQLNSFAAQNRYYTELISGNDNWQLVDIYADEGITGTSIEKRDDFKRMLRDCERGLIDRILVKSISRFARNTTECLETVRSLKSRGISVYFEKERIDIGKVSGEMLTAVFASLAQAESESISKNMRWSYQKRMQSNNFIPGSQPFGYKIECHKIVIDESRAAFVRMIFDDYLNGMSTTAIGKKLEKLKEQNIELQGRTWTNVTIGQILANEKYAGDCLWQKSYVTQSLPRKKLTNHGEKEKYFVRDNIPPIVTRENFENAQRLRAIRVAKQSHVVERQLLNSKVICQCCNRPMRRKVIRGICYIVCRNRDDDRNSCSTPHITEDCIRTAFCRLHYKLRCNEAALLKNMVYNLQKVRNSRMLWSADVIEINKKISDVLSQNQMLTMLKQQGLVDPDIFISKTNELTEQLRTLKVEKERLVTAESDDAISQTKLLIEILNDSPYILDDFDEELFGELVDKISINSNHIMFKLKNGLELKETIAGEG